MADEKTVNFLHSNGFDDLVTVFKVQGIDHEALTSLVGNDREVEELIPKIGLRIKFKKYLLDYVRFLSTLNRADSAESEAESLPSTVSARSSIFPPTSEDSVRTCDDGLIDLLDIERDLLPSDKDLFLPSPKYLSLNRQNDLLTTNNEIIKQTDLLTCDNEDLSSTIEQNSRLINDENQPPMKGPTPKKIPNILSNIATLNLKDLLLESPTGSLVLSLYKTNNGLDKSTRLRLVQTIIRSIIQKLPADNRQTMKNFHFEILAKKIVELFPSENTKIYYVAPFEEGDDQKISKGKLVVRYRNELREFRKCGFFTTKKSKSTSQSKSTVSENEHNISADSLRECTVHCDWLKHNTAPWSAIEEHWIASQPLRFKEYKSDGTVGVIYDRWPILRQPSGYLLLEKDFAEMFDDKLSMYAEWPKFSRKVQNLMQTEVKSQQYRDLLPLMNGSTVSEAARDVLILTLLPALCPPVARVKKGKGFWRPTIVESLNGFIRHVKVPGDLQPEIEKRVKQMGELQQRVQPYVIIVGPELTSIENSYVIIDDAIYHIEDTLKAVDVCFKAFHVLNAKYPVESEQVWLLLQKCIYKMETKWDKQMSSTSALIAQIDSCEIAAD